jgi:hypothetical protein
VNILECPHESGHSITIATFGLALISVTGIKLTINPQLGYFWQWTLGLWFLVLFVIVTPFRVWLAEKITVEAYEDAARPKISISDPIEIVNPKGAEGKAFRTWRLTITNVSTAVVKNCYAKKKSFINSRGQESDSLGLRFKFSTDNPRELQNYNYRQACDLNPNDREYVDIACMDERDGPTPNVFMLYAIPGGGSGFAKNAISQEVFPHRLVVEVSAENCVRPVEVTYDLYIKDGLLRMERVSL